MHQRKYSAYSPSAMTSAYRAVKENNLPLKRAAITYGVPKTTLRQRVTGIVDPETTPSGPRPELNQEQEAIFVEHLKCMAKHGYGYTSTEVTNMASNYAVFLHIRDEHRPFSLKWFRGFMKRWPELSVIKPRSLANYWAKATSQATVNDYFERLDQVFTKYNLIGKPHCVYNVDEKGIQTEHTPPYIVSSEKSVPAITSSRSAITTILGCGNALGTMLPPFFIFKGKRFRSKLLEGATAGSQGIVTDSGWSNSQAFLHFLEDHFIKYVQRGCDNQTLLLIFDVHKSHINIPVMEWAKRHNVELFVLPAHTSHILQPLDVGCFGPLQKIYNTECHKFIRKNPFSNITRYNVAELSSKAYEHGLSTQNLKSAFLRTGIYPFNLSAIEADKVIPATAFERQPSCTTNNSRIQDEPASFFKKAESFISNKQQVEKKVINTMSKKTSGTCITNDEIVKEIHSHLNKNIKATTKRKYNTSNSILVKKQIFQSKIKEPVAAPSGLQIVPISDSETDESDSDSDIPIEETCCVCQKFQPEELKKCVSLVITKWAQCDVQGCQHWTHLIYCCKQRVIRRNDNFICPCHSEE